MNKTYLVMMREIRATLRRKSFLALGFGLPLLLAIVAVIFIVISDPNPAVPEEAAPVTAKKSRTMGSTPTKIGAIRTKGKPR